MIDKETLHDFIGGLASCNKYDAELNTGDVINWLDEHIDRKRFTVAAATREGEYPLTDHDGRKFLLVAVKGHNCTEVVREGRYQMCCYMSTGGGDAVSERVSQSDADALGEGFRAWLSLQ